MTCKAFLHGEIPCEWGSGISGIPCAGLTNGINSFDATVSKQSQQHLF